jgi:hypothetical protein
MRTDLYLRTVLTVIAAALVYLCLVFTPIPGLAAQGRPVVVGAQTPGEYTGPAEVVIVGWRLPNGDSMSLPVHVTRGDVRVVNDVQVTGRVEAVQPENRPYRNVLIGYEEGGSTSGAGRFAGLRPRSGQGIPVTPWP